MVSVPALTPVTIPDNEPTVATAMVLPDHVPPPASESVSLASAHTLSEPDMLSGSGLTLTNTVAAQPEPIVYEICVVPANMPVSTPVEPMVATPGALLLQAPPEVPSVSETVLPAHNAAGPAMDDGDTCTVTAAVAIQPVGSV